MNVVTVALRIAFTGVVAAAAFVSAPGESAAAPQEGDPGRADAPSRSDLDAALAKGVAFLLRAQRPDGGWISAEYSMDSAGHKTAITAVAMEAVLAGTGGSVEAQDAARRGLGFLETHAPEIRGGKIHHGFDFNGWGAAYGLRHLAGVRDRWPAKSKAPDMKRLVDLFVAWAEANRKPCGGWSYLTKEQDPAFEKDGSVSFFTGVMLEGLARWDPKSPLVAPAAEDLAKSGDGDGRVLYSHTGAWSAPPRGREESAGRSLQAALVLGGLGRRDAGDVETRLAEFLAVRGEYVKTRTQHPHTPPHYIAGYYYYHAHSYAARALRWLAAREKTPSPQRAARVAELLAALVAEQSGDGSWIDAPCGGTSYATALAVLELTDLRELLFPWTPTLDAALESAKERSVPVVVLFTDGGRDSTKAEETLQSKELEALRERCLWVRVPKDAANAATWKTAKAGTGGAILVLGGAGGCDLAAPAARFGATAAAKLVLKAVEKLL